MGDVSSSIEMCTRRVYGTNLLETIVGSAGARVGWLSPKVDAMWRYGIVAATSTLTIDCRAGWVQMVHRRIFTELLARPLMPSPGHRTMQ